VKRAARSYISSIGSEQSGYILFMVIFVVFVVSLVGIMLIVVGTSEVNVATRSKMMEQAYAVAEAGINRAAMTVSSDSGLPYSRINESGQVISSTDLPGTTQTLQWHVTGERILGGESHGKYSVEVHYDTSNPTEVLNKGYGDTCYKLVISNGTYTWGSQSVERTIEAKMYIPYGGQEFNDDAFRYCIFNGLRSQPVGQGNWPSGKPGTKEDENNNEFSELKTGRYTIDGATEYVDDTDPNNIIRATPKGAIYTRGNIQLKFGSFVRKNYDKMDIKGNIVATNDLTVYADVAYHRVYLSFGDKLNLGSENPGNNNSLIAGLGGTGNATFTGVTAEESPNNKEPAFSKLMIYDTVLASGNVTVQTPTTLNQHLLRPYGGLVAGGNVVIAPRGLRTSLTIGPITSVGSTLVDNRFGGITKISKITAGSNTTNNTLLPLDMDLNPNYLTCWGLGVGLVAGSRPLQVEGPISSRGEVVGMNLERNGSLSLQDINAGYGNNIAYPPNFFPNSYEPTGQSVNYGVWLYLLEECRKIGNITSYGRVNIETSGNLIGSIGGTIKAGTDNPSGLGGVGVYFNGIGTGSDNIGCNQEVDSVGDIVMSATTGRSSTIQAIKQPLWSGGNIILSNTGRIGGTINVLNCQAGGNITVTSSTGVLNGRTSCKKAIFNAGGKVDLTTTKDRLFAGRIRANGNVTLTSATYLYISDLISSQNDVTLTCNRYATSTKEVMGIWGNNVTINRGIGTGSGMGVYQPPSPPSDNDANTLLLKSDAVLANNQITLNAPGKTIKFYGNIRYGLQNGLTSTSGSIYTFSGNPAFQAIHEKNTWINNKPALVSVPAPSTPPRPDPPTMADLLYMANLKRPIVVPVPNWPEFLSAAKNDDISNPPDPNDPNSAFHLIYDGCPADHDSTPGQVTFEWNSTNYSPNETVYCTDSSKVVIKIKNWKYYRNENLKPGMNFTGTLVTQGDVDIDASQADLRLRTGNILNIVSGSDIRFLSSKSFRNLKCHFHFYAYNNIILTDNWQRGETDFWGSFTAGNKVIFQGAVVQDKYKWTWSPWNLDPSEWLVPSFKVLSWREV